jgi:hypothetical protein
MSWLSGCVTISSKYFMVLYELGWIEVIKFLAFMSSSRAKVFEFPIFVSESIIDEPGVRIFASSSITLVDYSW